MLSSECLLVAVVEFFGLVNEGTQSSHSFSFMIIRDWFILIRIQTLRAESDDKHWTENKECSMERSVSQRRRPLSEEAGSSKRMKALVCEGWF